MHYQSSLQRRAGYSVLEEGAAIPSPPVRGLGSAVSSPSGVRGGAPAAKGYTTFEVSLTQEDLSWHFSGVIVTEDRTSQNVLDCCQNRLS